MAGATPIKASFGPNNLGTFKAQKFNLFEDNDLEAYSELRNRANDASAGVKIEMMREYARKTTTHDGDGASAVTTTTEEIFLLVQYWEKPPKREKGASDDELKEAKQDFAGTKALG
jgi:hypothetical protein